jgi:hypothetical protein
VDGIRVLHTVEMGIERPFSSIEVVIVSKVVIESEVEERRHHKVALSSSLTVVKEGNGIVNSCLATVGPEIVLIDAEVAVASTIVINTESTVELAKIIADSVTSSVEGNLTERVVNPTRSGRLVVSLAIKGMASNNWILLAISEIRHVAVKVVASATTTRAVKVSIIDHASAIILSKSSHRERGSIALNVTPVPVSTAVIVVSGLSNATNSAQSGTEARVASASEDVAHVVDALTRTTLTTIALRSN